VVTNRYGNGLDSTVRVSGDPAFCLPVHGVPSIDCHLEGWPTRVQCEMALIKGCPVWQYRTGPEDLARQCFMAKHPVMNCDHHGDPVYRDDPETPDVFEGRPSECGRQRDAMGNPKAGFFVIAHGKGEVRACRPDMDAETCGDWKAIDF